MRSSFFGLQGGGGVFVDSNGVANFENCNIHENMATSVRFIIEPFPELSSITPMVCSPVGGMSWQGWVSPFA